MKHILDMRSNPAGVDASTAKKLTPARRLMFSKAPLSDLRHILSASRQP
jgi:hypothetical protein